MTVHEKRRVRRGELEVIQPVGVVLDQLGDGPRLQIHREKRVRQPGTKSESHVLLLVLGLAEILVPHPVLLDHPAPVDARADDVALDVGARAEGLVGVYRDDARPFWQVGYLMDLARVDVGGPQRKVK